MRDLVECGQDSRMEPRVDDERDLAVVELWLSYPYLKEHPWVVQAVTGFLSAYFMEHPGFRVQRHFDDLESGAHVWLCEVPAAMKVPSLLRRLQADVPPFHSRQSTDASGRARYVLGCPERT
ncbi:hypothetical protein NITMOv2_2021 [Nitrospira moscoviensis]|uniref:Uncharacterized protein n=1 Tax=Nitrospira moscoviensis TaxID=42253 RepID=A0A0K2GBW8_NITMO|nr:hypothetical protein NITMOv2_2021 [Nitrospira moscoviensis]